MKIIPYVDGWEKRLDSWVVRSHLMPFQWGVHDCGLNAASAVEAQIGYDFAADFRGHYDSYESGLALLKDKGFDSHADLAATLLPEIPPAFAQIGDLAAVDFGSAGITLMVVAGHRLIGPMPHMAGNISRLKARRAFAVGYEPRFLNEHDA
jgi:hypothetical protein